MRGGGDRMQIISWQFVFVCVDVMQYIHEYLHDFVRIFVGLF